MAYTFSTSQLPKVVRTWCVLYILWRRNVLRARMAYTFSTSQLPKVVRTWCVLYILWRRNVLRATMAYTFRHLNFRKWSEHGVFCTFWLRNMLRATTACNFSSLIWPAGSAPVALEPTCRPSGATNQIIGKTECFATFLPFRAPGSSFFWGLLFCDLLSSSLLFSSLLWLFPSLLLFVHIVGSLTSKLPSARVDLQFRCLTSGVCWFNLHIYSPVWLPIKANCFLTIKHIQTWLDRNSPLKLDMFTSSIILKFIINHLDFLQS